LRKPTSPSLRFSAETPDEEEEVLLGGVAAAGACEEATLGWGRAADAGGEAGEVYDAGATNEAEDTGAADDAGAAGADAIEDADSAGAEDVDDAGKMEKDEQAASIGISAIAAAVTPKRKVPLRPANHPSTPARRRHPAMPHLYQAPGVNHKAERPPERSPVGRSGVWRN
jgi:hypothetical protein